MRYTEYQNKMEQTAVKYNNCTAEKYNN
jgi:hypothetical protein